MQLRLWGEMVAGGSYASLDKPPASNTMFLQSGGESEKKQSPMVKAFTDAATAITSAVLEKPQGQQKSIPSPGKLIENRSRLYRQLSDQGMLVFLVMRSNTKKKR